MTHLLIVILGQRRHLAPLLEAWRSVGVPGATILSSAGAFRSQTWLARIGLGGLESVFDRDETAQPTLLAVVDDEPTLERAVAEAERITGGFDLPGNGVLLVVPVTRAIGIHGLRSPADREAPPAPVHPDWEASARRTVAEIASNMRLAPTSVAPDATLEEVARAMTENPAVTVVCVVDAAGVVVGLIDLLSLADDLFLHIAPDEFLAEVTDLQEALRFAELSRARTAADAMRAPLWLTPSDTCRDAFRRMHDARLTGLPLVDATYRPVGHVNLVDLLAACAGGAAATSGEHGGDA